MTNHSPSATAAGAGAAAGIAISRRQFLKTAAGSIAGSAFVFPALVPASALGREAGVPAPSNRLQLGVLGAKQGKFNWSRCSGFKDVVTVAVCEVDGRRREEFTAEVNRHYRRNVATGYADFREMFAKARLDAVILAAPDHWHGVLGVAAARAGVHVWGEKPLAHSVAEGRAIVNAVARHGVAWQTGSWQRSLPYFRRVGELARNGRIGKIVRVECGTGGVGQRAETAKPSWAHSAGGDIGKPPAHLDYEMWVGPAPWRDYHPGVTHYDWRMVLNFGGGALMDWVGHYYDIAQWALGLDATGPVKVTGSGEFLTPNRAYPYDCETRYRYDCEYADGLVISAGSEFAPGTKFIGESGKWLLVQRNRPVRASDKRVLGEVIGTDEMRLYKSDNHWRNWLDCAKQGTQPIAHAEAGHRAASAGLLGQIAIATGRPLRWDPVKEEILDDPAANALLRPQIRGGWAL